MSKKITLNELRNLVKQVIKEESENESIDELFGLFKKTAFDKLKSSDDILVSLLRSKFDDSGNREEEDLGKKRFGSYDKMVAGTPWNGMADVAIIYWNLADDDTKSSIKVSTDDIDNESMMKNNVQKKFGADKKY